jgi:hypothetical protein
MADSADSPGSTLPPGNSHLKGEMLVGRTLGHQHSPVPDRSGRRQPGMGAQGGIREAMFGIIQLCAGPGARGNYTVSACLRNDPVIELTPKNPFSWKIVAIFVAGLAGGLRARV